MPDRPEHLIRVAVPRLNKQDRISSYLDQLEQRDYDTTWAEVTDAITLTPAEWNQFMSNLLENRAWLDGKGGCNTWAEIDGDDFYKLTDAQRDEWRRCSYILVVAVSCGGRTIYIDPQEYGYARYVAFSAEGLRPEKTREEIRRDEELRRRKQEQDELRKRFANPPVVPPDHGLRFLFNGIKYDGKLYKCNYSLAVTDIVYPEGSILIDADFHFPEPAMRYFPFDLHRLLVGPNHPLYSAVSVAFQAQRDHAQKRAQRLQSKYAGAIQ